MFANHIARLSPILLAIVIAWLLTAVTVSGQDREVELGPDNAAVTPYTFSTNKAFKQALDESVNSAVQAEIEKITGATALDRTKVWRVRPAGIEAGGSAADLGGLLILQEDGARSLHSAWSRNPKNNIVGIAPNGVGSPQYMTPLSGNTLLEQVEKLQKQVSAQAAYIRALEAALEKCKGEK